MDSIFSFMLSVAAGVTYIAEPGLRLPASASLSLASCWPRPQQLLPVSAAGGGRRRCSQRERLSSGADPIKCITLLPVGHTAQRKEGLFVQTFYKICLILMIVGGINWGLVGLFQFDFVGWLLGGSASIWSRIVFTLVGVAAVCGIPGLFTDETGE